MLKQLAAVAALLALLTLAHRGWLTHLRVPTRAPVDQEARHGS